MLAGLTIKAKVPYIKIGMTNDEFRKFAADYKGDVGKMRVDLLEDEYGQFRLRPITGSNGRNDGRRLAIIPPTAQYSFDFQVMFRAKPYNVVAESVRLDDVRGLRLIPGMAQFKLIKKCMVPDPDRARVVDGTKVTSQPFMACANQLKPTATTSEQLYETVQTLNRLVQGLGRKVSFEQDDKGLLDFVIAYQANEVRAGA